MPYIQARLTIKLDETQKDELQKKLSEATADALSKPKAYIMTAIEDGKTLYMNENNLAQGAYIAIRMLGTTTKAACQNLTERICSILSAYGINGSNIYITYHPVDLWGWNGSMF